MVNDWCVRQAGVFAGFLPVLIIWSNDTASLVAGMMIDVLFVNRIRAVDLFQGIRVIRLINGRISVFQYD